MNRELALRLHKERCMREPDTGQWPIQLGMHGDPWKVALACMLLNQTAGEQVRPILREVLDSWPDPMRLLLAHTDEIYRVVKPLGLGATRAYNIKAMSAQFLFGPWRDMSQLRGLGEYAMDAVRIFCLGDLTVEPKDKVLQAFLRAV